ncbi:MAG: glutamate-5-semialdehyde dehydrogenase [Solirubrobacteraceae bacterium]
MDSILHLLKATKIASKKIGILTKELKNKILVDIAQEIENSVDLIIEENTKDLVLMQDSDPKKDRLLLNKQRLIDIVKSVIQVSELEDPVGKIYLENQLENGLLIKKMAVPLGVVGVIYESRPNVTIDVAVLAIKSGNGVVLRGGSDAFHSNKILVSIIQSVLKKNNLPVEAICLLPTDRKHAKELLEAVNYIDILIPRGSKSLIDFVRNNAKIPTIETGAGVCHTYVEKSANLENAANIVINAKVQRPSVCNSLDTILVDREILADFLPKIKEGLEKYKVKIYADENSYKILQNINYTFLEKANNESFGTEFLGYECSIKTVNGMDDALEHIDRYSSKHSEAVITSNKELANIFLNVVDAAAVYHNASTRFTDGEQFGLGAEIGISTQKLHARGPFALEKLVTEKWMVYGNGQIRK